MFFTNIQNKKYNIVVRYERSCLTTLHDVIGGSSNYQVEGTAAGVGGTTYMLDQPKWVKQGCEAEPFTIINRVKMNVKITKEDQLAAKSGGLF